MDGPLLDTARNGPLFLRQDKIAQVVQKSLYTGEQLGHYQLHAWVVMANHVHVLLTPRIQPSRLIASLKGTTAARPTNCLDEPESRFGRQSVTTGGFGAKKNSAAFGPTLSTIR